MPLVTHITHLLRAFFSPPHLRSLNQQWRREGGGYPSDVIDDTLHMLGRSDLHYEHLLGHLQTQHRRIRNDALAQGYYGMYQRLVEAVSAVLAENQVASVTYCKRGFPAFEGLKALCDSAAPLWIFSLNHDLVLEMLANHLQIPVRDGYWPSGQIVIPTQKGCMKADVLSEQQIEDGELLFFEPREHGINLFKLHGSLDTFAFRDGLDMCRLRPSSTGPRGYIDSLRRVNEIAFMDEGGRFHATNEIVYSDAAGVPQFLRRSILAGAQKFDRRFSQTLPQRLLDIFKGYVNHVKVLYVIGYSFGDAHVDLTLREWLEFSPARRLVVVDPFRTRVPEGFGHLANQVSVETRRASDFFIDLRATPLSRAERLEMDLRHRLRPWTERRQVERYRRQCKAA